MRHLAITKLSGNTILGNVTFDRESGEHAIEGVPVRLLSDLDEATKQEYGLSEIPNVYRVFVTVDLDDTYVNPAYQRGKIETKIAAMDPFNPIAAGTPIGAYDPEHVDGRIRHVSIMDGQQRMEAARREGVRRFGFSLWFGLSRAMQAEIFAICNTNNEGATAFDVFKARLYASHPDYVRINEIMAKYRIKVVSSVVTPDNLETKAIGTIVRLYNSFGGEYLDNLFSILVGSWGGYRTTLSEYFIKAMHSFLQAFGDRIDQRRLMKVVSGDPDKFYIEATTESTLRTIRNYKPEIGVGGIKRIAISRILAEMFVDLYNHRLRGEHLNKQELDANFRRAMKAQGKRVTHAVREDQPLSEFVDEEPIEEGHITH